MLALHINAFTSLSSPMWHFLRVWRVHTRFLDCFDCASSKFGTDQIDMCLKKQYVINPDQSVQEAKSHRVMFLITSSLSLTHATTLDVVCAARCPAPLQLEDGGMEALFCTLAQHSPTEVKIVPCSILLQQSQRWLSQKQYLDMAADVPKQAQEDRPARGTFGTVRLRGEWGKSCKQCGLWGHLRGEHKCCLESLLETLDL